MTIGNVVGFERFKQENQAVRLVAWLPSVDGISIRQSALMCRSEIRREFNGEAQGVEEKFNT